MTGGKLKIDIRRKRILEQLRLEGKVSVTELSKTLDVPPVTIRNDLAAMEQEGQLLRIQGGAVQLRSGGELSGNRAAEDIYAEEKKISCQTHIKKCVNHILTCKI